MRKLRFLAMGCLRGFSGRHPLDFYNHSYKFITFFCIKPKLSIDNFRGKKIFKLDCKSVAIINFLIKKNGSALGSSNKYPRLFTKKIRHELAKYLPRKYKNTFLKKLYFSICFNLIDHTNDAHEWLELFFKPIKTGSRFFEKINTIKDSFKRTKERHRIHTFPLNLEKLQYTPP